jgi:hypothetical protein
MSPNFRESVYNTGFETSATDIFLMGDGIPGVHSSSGFINSWKCDLDSQLASYALGDALPFMRSSTCNKIIRQGKAGLRLKRGNLR